MVAKISATGCKTRGDYKAAVLRICEKVPIAMLENLFASMPKRMRRVVEKGGDKTGY